MIRFHDSSEQWGWFSYVEDNNLVIGESTPHEGGVLYRGLYLGENTPYLHDIKKDDPKQYRKIVKYFLQHPNHIQEKQQSDEENIIREFTDFLKTYTNYDGIEVFAEYFLKLKNLKENIR